jgi:hypothetical protein
MKRAGASGVILPAMTRRSDFVARSLGQVLVGYVTRLAFPKPLSRLSADLSAYELGRYLARRERRRRRARMRRAALLGAALSTAAFAAAHARGASEE